MKHVPQDLPALPNPQQPAQSALAPLFQGTFSFTWVPVRARIVEHFNAPNPWRGKVQAEWTLEVFRMVNVRTLPLYTNGKLKVQQQEAGGRTGPAEVLGLRDAREERLRSLPRALAELWQAGMVPTCDLPRLMAVQERALAANDYFSLRNRYLKWLALFFLVPMALFIAFAAADAFLARHQPHELTPAQWLAKPVTAGGSVSVHEPFPIEGYLPVESVTVPSFIENAAPQDNVLVWYKAAEGERLALLAPLNAGPVVHSGAQYISLEGPVLPLEDLHLAPQVLQSVRARTTNLQTGSIVCSGWRWSQQNSPLGGIPELWLGAAGFFLLLSAFFFWRYGSVARRLAQLKDVFLQAL